MNMDPPGSRRCTRSQSTGTRGSRVSDELAGEFFSPGFCQTNGTSRAIYLQKRLYVPRTKISPCTLHADRLICRRCLTSVYETWILPILAHVVLLVLAVIDLIVGRVRDTQSVVCTVKRRCLGGPVVVPVREHLARPGEACFRGPDSRALPVGNC